MRHLATSLIAVASVVAATSSSKRGLVYVASTHSSDDSIWDSSSSDLTWYYNYQVFPTTEYTSSKLEFVPQLWGAPSDPANDMTFYDSVSNLIQGGMNITHVLGFNEPDASVDGGSDVPASDAATIWKKQLEPLRAKYGVKLGAPAVTGGSTGWTWLQDFFTACSALSNSSCEVDFMTVHWYGNFEGLASHVAQVNSTYQNISATWVTEFGYPNVTLYEAQDFYNSSIGWLDNQTYVSRYSYFGAFRSDVSNVGPNAAFLTSNGKLTTIGNWYLGEANSGAVPGSAATMSKFGGWGLLVAIAIFCARF